MAACVEPGERVLDLCCGSARSAAPVARRTGRAVVGVDISAAMLAQGKRHAEVAGVRFAPVRADAFRLPFADRTFDAITIAWGLRNLRPESEALAELQRVLRPGGRLVVLESPSPEPGLVGFAHRLYLQAAVPMLGRLSSDPEAYAYLSCTVLSYGTLREVTERLERAGFRVRRAQPLFLGAAALWTSETPDPANEPMGRSGGPEPSVHDAMTVQNSIAGTGTR
jgi:demethylmenaquinone methyltransferase/2-methoxy-6-polyprenyl-1,4-benzoquinol methylase